MNKILEHEGRLYVSISSSKFDEPINLELWYPTDVRSRDYPDLINRLCEPDINPGVYKVLTDHNPFSPVKIALSNRGSTQPEFVIETPIPAPKTRVETRYMRGSWYKLLKSKGWVLA